MSRESDPELMVALALRLKGFGELGDVSSVHDLDVSLVETVLTKMLNDGKCLVRDVDGVQKYILTPTGRELGEELLRLEIDDSGTRSSIQMSYEKFLLLNPAMLQLCTDWQVIVDADGEQRLNDHKDASYDEMILERLVKLESDLFLVLRDLETALMRYGGYAARFSYAREKLMLGELDWLTKPIMPSYHTVWFELHEDLLASLGIDRASESAS
ncbi:MAG TPA: transcriptional regulator [Acidimicrobiaceae bacterium]|nr:transcriptional regulator [Acidimicrobiaceae bacterium]HAY65879.1 transcriptional regulator [Acidimicrobiaceae bacterium]HBV25019.1 transcriptional regulator [Acidimicrobiaceae bacterium]|tara:strand:+ start:3315 stop:3956 length:642 start_codon:yes stop_codon:yes gene_type:complete